MKNMKVVNYVGLKLNKEERELWSNFYHFCHFLYNELEFSDTRMANYVAEIVENMDTIEEKVRIENEEE